MERFEPGRRFFFGTNLKMNQTASESIAFLDGLADAIDLDHSPMQFFVIPPFTSLSAVARHPARAALWVGAQNMHWAEKGAFTGEISAAMLREFDIDLVLIGHAERRQHFGDTDPIVQRKIEAVLGSGMRALLCVGETAAAHDAGTGREHVLAQLRTAIENISDAEAAGLLVAYEPIWSIGEGGTPARPDEVEAMMVTMRAQLDDRFGPDVRPPLLYGGSVDAGNCAAFAAIPAIDGLFVGRAAWTVCGFAETARRSQMARFGNRQ